MSTIMLRSTKSGHRDNVGVILINVGEILTGAILQWGDLTRYQTKSKTVDVKVC